MNLSKSDKRQIRDYLMEAKNCAVRALGRTGPHSRRLTRKLEKICSELEAAQRTASILRTSDQLSDEQ